MRAGAGNCAVVGCSRCAGGWPCPKGGWPYLEGVGPCGEGGGEPKAAMMFSNGSLHSGGPKNPSALLYSPTRPSFSPTRPSFSPTRPSFSVRFTGSIRFSVTHSSAKMLNRSPSEISMNIKPTFSSSPSIFDVFPSKFQFSDTVWFFLSALLDLWAGPNWASAHRACALWPAGYD